MSEMSAGDYVWDEEEAGSNSYLAGPIVDILAALQVKRLLDLGCGNGTLTKHFVKLGCEIVGCEPDATGVELAMKNVPGAKFFKCGVYDSPNHNDLGKFDVVVSTEVIEHLFLPRRLVEFAREVLTPRGYLVLSTPYHGYLKNLSICFLNKWDFHHCSLQDGSHIKFWSHRTIRELVESENFEVVRFVGAGRFKWFWKSMIVVCRLK